MPTSLHIPKPLLDAVDKRAHALRLSRNRLIVRAIERDMIGDSQWSPGFFARLAETDSDTDRAVDELLDAVRRGRTSKPPRRL